MSAPVKTAVKAVAGSRCVLEVEGCLLWHHGAYVGKLRTQAHQPMMRKLP